MQYTKLGFLRLFKGCGSHQMQCSLIGNRSVIPNFAYCQPLELIFKTYILHKIKLKWENLLFYYHSDY